ncbi:hypothetical protein BD626DRAFT_510679 [Schizophyllum amplum]|uniref:Uncharacterized protein n=1 Tax=Schizophyllum amplum TaxID=97359 RepID=A0A550C1Z3_9AGAR|nr:hypothetical protein BD626DRAFT_510679 [Auriculariopsis ampla]
MMAGRVCEFAIWMDSDTGGHWTSSRDLVRDRLEKSGNRHKRKSRRWTRARKSTAGRTRDV